MEFFLAQEAHRPAIHTLWRQVFGDDEAFIDASLDVFAGPGHVYVAQQEGRVVAQLLAVPCRLGGQRGCYLYALATSPTARRGGVMTGLMQFAEGSETGQGARFVALIPANGELFGYYRRRGYTLDIPLRHLTLRIAPGAPGDAVFGHFTAREFAGLRQQYLHSGYIHFGTPAYAMLLTDLYQSGVQSVRTTGAYAIYQPQKTGLLLAELGGCNDKSAWQLLRAVASREGRWQAHITLGQNSPLFERQGQLLPYGLLKPLGTGGCNAAPYLRFGFDTVG